MVATVETIALSTAIVVSVDYVAVKTAAIMVSLFVGAFLLGMALMELFPSNLESQIERELTQGLKSKD